MLFTWKDENQSSCKLITMQLQNMIVTRNGHKISKSSCKWLIVACNHK